jgi:hypothetical protein
MHVAWSKRRQALLPTVKARTRCSISKCLRRARLGPNTTKQSSSELFFICLLPMSLESYSFHCDETLKKDIHLLLAIPACCPGP